MPKEPSERTGWRSVLQHMSASKNRTDILTIYRQKYGTQKQLIVAAKEMADLQKCILNMAIGRQSDSGSFIEKIADAELVLLNLKLLIPKDKIDNLEQIIDSKVEKLRQEMIDDPNIVERY